MNFCILQIKSIPIPPPIHPIIPIIPIIPFYFISSFRKIVFYFNFPNIHLFISYLAKTINFEPHMLLENNRFSISKGQNGSFFYKICIITCNSHVNAAGFVTNLTCCDFQFFAIASCDCFCFGFYYLLGKIRFERRIEVP